MDGVDANLAREDGTTPLHIACQFGQLDVVRMLLSTDGVDVNQAIDDGSTPLLIVCQKCQVDVMRVLLNTTRVDVNQATQYWVRATCHSIVTPLAIPINYTLTRTLTRTAKIRRTQTFTLAQFSP